MKKAIFAVLAVMAFAAQASNNSNGPTTNNNQTYNQPQGGQGGTANAGAIGVGVGIGGGAEVKNTLNTNISNDVRNNAAASVIGSGNSSNKNTNTNSNKQGQVQGQSQSTNNANNSQQSVSVAGDNVNFEAQKRDPVSTAYAAGLTATNGTCFGSASVGAQGVGFGVSFGSTTFDDNCDRRYDSQELRALGQAEAALALMCQKDSVAQAMKASGKSCHMQGTTNTTSVAVSVPTAKYEHTDPIVRARLGLPPLK